MQLSTLRIVGLCSYSQDECCDAYNLLFVDLKKLNRSLQILCFCIYNNNAFQFSIFSKIVTCIRAYQNSKFLIVIGRIYFRLMHNRPMIVFYGVLLQMHNTFGMRWEKVIQIEIRICCI
jgi:hypothetical protein